MVEKMHFDDIERSSSKFLDDLMEGDETSFGSDENAAEARNQWKESTLETRLDMVLSSVTHLGCEVQRLQDQVFFLQDHNSKLLTSFTNLKAVISERGILELDDFNLACEVFEQMTHEDRQQRYSKNSMH